MCEAPRLYCPAPTWSAVNPNHVSPWFEFLANSSQKRQTPIFKHNCGEVLQKQIKRFPQEKTAWSYVCTRRGTIDEYYNVCVCTNAVWVTSCSLAAYIGNNQSHACWSSKGLTYINVDSATYKTQLHISYWYWAAKRFDMIYICCDTMIQRNKNTSILFTV